MKIAPSASRVVLKRPDTSAASIEPGTWLSVLRAVVKRCPPTFSRTTASPSGLLELSLEGSLLSLTNEMSGAATNAETK